MFGIVQSQALMIINYVCSTVLILRHDGVEEGVGLNRRSAPARHEKQITVTSSGGAGANHFCKSMRYQGNVQEAGEVTV